MYQLYSQQFLVWTFWGGFHKVIFALNLKYGLCTLLFSLIFHHVFVPYAQLIAFSPRFRCVLCFTPCSQLLWNPPQMFQQFNFFGNLNTLNNINSFNNSLKNFCNDNRLNHIVYCSHTANELNIPLRISVFF